MKSSVLFHDRRAAGQALAHRLIAGDIVTPRSDTTIVLALPRGGVPVALEIARALAAPLDLVFVRKIGVPLQSELAAAAVVDGGDAQIVLNEDVVEASGLTNEKVQSLARTELAEIERRRQIYFAGRTHAALEGRTIVVVDDGIATGATVRAALKALRRKRPRRLLLAVPVAPREVLEELRRDVDTIVCLATPEPFHAVGAHYRDFHQVTDAEVIRDLDAAAAFARNPVVAAAS
jgi:putative phosphoribosyl transferase